MDTVDPARFIFASFFVLGLLALLALILKRYGQKNFGAKLFAPGQAGGRISIVETRYLDAKSKLVLVKRDGVEHLLLLSDGRATMIESGIESGTKAGINDVA